MSRFLFVSLPLTGHVNPIAAVSHALVQSGHEVAWAGSESFLRPLVGVDVTIFPIPLRAHRGQAARGMAATKTRWEGYILPHARVTRAGIETAIAEFRPDAMLVDQHAIGAAALAIKHDVPWVSLAPGNSELARPHRGLPKVERWIDEKMTVVWQGAGMTGTPPHDLRFSPHLLIGFSTAALLRDIDVPANARFVGPALGTRAPDTTFPWEWLDSQRSHVLVTMGTIGMDLSRVFYVRVIEALRPLADRVQAIVVAPDGTITDPGDHVLVRSRVPMLDLLGHVDAVVCHGGFNTVCETLAAGVPLVVAPIKDDQPINAVQVAAAGAGVRVSFDRARPDALRAVLLDVLDNPAYREAAARVQTSLSAAGGATAAVHHLEGLLAGNTTPHHKTPMAESGRRT